MNNENFDLELNNDVENFNLTPNDEDEEFTVEFGEVFIEGEELDLKQLSTFDSTKIQVLKNINGTLTWVNE